MRATATTKAAVEPPGNGWWKLARSSVQGVALPIAAVGLLGLVVVGLLFSGDESQPTSPARRAPRPAALPTPNAVPHRLPIAVAPPRAPAVRFLTRAPAIRADSIAPHGNRGPCNSCHRIKPALATSAIPAPITASPNPAPPIAAPANATGGEQIAATRVNTDATLDATTGASARIWAAGATQAAATPNRPLPFQEAHWQGLEVISLSPGLARVLGLPRDSRGVVVDEVTMPADSLGFAAGDLITAVGDMTTLDLESFVAAADHVRDRREIEIVVERRGEPKTLVLQAERLGTANGETAPMIPSGARLPHSYLGPCTNCHRIGTRGSLAVDLGDLLSKTAPPIRTGQKRTHADRGTCSACHTIQ